METKFTKGEWTWESDEYGTKVWCGDSVVAKLVSESEEYESSIPMHETIPNAKLIAAAPDLLEALMSALPYLQQYALSIVTDKAEAAIKKTTE